VKIESVELRNFRNYKALELKADSNLNVFVGANAQGKTNLLEALTFLAAGKSFRTRSETEMVQWGESFCTVAGKVIHQHGDSKLKISYNAQTKHKSYIVNGKEQSKSALVRKFAAVLFTPEDLELVKGAPFLRRRFIDEEICKVSPQYEYSLARYQQVVRQRNQLLRTYRQKIIDSDELAGWNEQLAKLSAAIIKKRLAAIHRLGLLARLVHRKLTGREESFELSYRTPLTIGEEAGEEEIFSAVMAGLAQNKENEARQGQTLVGPHRDDLALRINGREARHFASQGQQRTLVLALKMAELEFFKGERGEFPVLLFDDVFSELDERRRRLLVEAIDGRVQTFITGTEVEKMGRLRVSGTVFSVADGEVKKFEEGI